jgi:signal transduction histidine kinase/Flp pilus assembly protein TadD
MYVKNKNEGGNTLYICVLLRFLRTRVAWCIFIFVFYPPIAVCIFGQNVDSLYQIFTEARGNRRISLVNEIAQAVYTLECTDTLFHVENNVKQELVDAVSCELMAAYNLYSLNNLPKSIAFSLDAAKLYEKAGDVRAMDLNYSNAGKNYFLMGYFETAIDLMLKCYELQKQWNDPEALGATLNNLGIAYSNWGYHEMAMEYLRQAVEIERPLDRPTQLATRLSNLAKETSLAGNHIEALRLVKEALVHAERIERNERTERIAVHQSIMGRIYVELDSLSQAEACFTNAVAVFEQNNRQQRLAEALLDMGRLQLRQRRFAEAIETLKKCLDISEKNRLLRVMQDGSDYLYEAYKQTGQSTQALIYLERYRALNDSIFKETTQKQLSEFQIKYDTAEKELEIERQQSEISRHKARQNMLFGSLAVAALLLVLLIYIVRLRNHRNRELTETNATKDKFFSIISHDLKNPAIAQRDALQLLLDNSDKWSASDISNYYRKLLKSADGQVDLLYNLLNWAQVQTGRMPFIPVPFDLAAALQSDIDLIKSMAERKGIFFDVHAPEAAIVTGDDNMLVTIVRNLLTNAVKFTLKDGNVSLQISEENGKHTVSVTDTGTGMTPEQLQKLFRIDSQRSRRGTIGEQGSGLGLIVCKELLEKHGSTLHVESEAGKGSRFWFTL